MGWLPDLVFLIMLVGAWVHLAREIAGLHREMVGLGERMAKLEGLMAGLVGQKVPPRPAAN